MQLLVDAWGLVSQNFFALIGASALTSVGWIGLWKLVLRILP